MTRDQLISQVVLRMDEITPNITVASLTVDGADNNPLYELVKGIIDDGVLELFSVAPYWRLPQSAFESVLVAAGANSKYIIRLKIPDNFLRVAEINCPLFHRPITEVVSEQSPEGRRQHNRFLMAGLAKPVGVMSHGEWSDEPCREIDCYSLPESIETNEVEASYIAIPAPSSDATAWTTQGDPVPDALKPALEWLIASLAFGARGDTGHASICQQKAQNLLV